MSAPRYEIQTIADMARIPRERWDVFLVDLKITVDALRATHQAFDLGPENTLDGVMVWTDDDAPGCTLNVCDPAGGLLFTATAGEDA